MGWVVVLMPLALLALGFPFFLILLATASIVLALFAGIPTTAIHQVMYASIDKYALLAVPFFIFAGDLMGRGGVSQRLVRSAPPPFSARSRSRPRRPSPRSAGSPTTACGRPATMNGSRRVSSSPPARSTT